MEIANSANPLGTLQMVSILSCVRSLTDVLYAENFLNTGDQYKPTQIVNGLFHYILDKNNFDINQRKQHLFERIGNNCNLTETKDLNIINKKLKQIVEYLIFNEYKSIDEFMKNILALNSSSELSQLFKETLQDELFLQNTEVKSKTEGKIRSKRSPLRRILIPVAKKLPDAANIFLKNAKLLGKPVRQELVTKFDFEEVERNKLQDITSKFQSKPIDVNNPIKIIDADIFNQMKYLEVIDKSDLSINEAVKRIDFLYPIKENQDIRKELNVEDVLNDFKKKKAYKDMKLEDYYAIRWYGVQGHRKMGGNSDQARRMENAILRLSIRQFFTPEEEYSQNLYRGELRNTKDVEKELSANEFQFTRFTSASTDKNMAISYSGGKKSEPGKTSVLYEMNFNEPIIRARVHHLMVKDESETILIPGTKFHIESKKEIKSCKAKELDADVRCLIVKISALDNKNTVAERRQKILDEVKALAQSGTKFYYDPPK
ncbi:uncharacterized protein LOC127284005 [Leptopilina boulardi]|uniref:uncharacterized protein LOC127284005 n=1 Tax=Leptopilina boulardi TaxID=63433 RepID=UPI0021F69222|nr:uncharacterized protein LOC127284005 [Leptopilina boulardi]